ncbi:MAG: hypothetical protein ACIALR_08995 [Blastopirellula sp. JB062]
MKLEDTATRQSRSSAAGRAYAFFVTALAVVAIGLYFCRMPIESVTARWQLVVSADLADKMSLLSAAQEAKTETLSDAALHSIAERLPHVVDQANDLPSLRQHIEIEIAPRPTGDQADVSILASAATMKQALTLTEEIGETFKREIDQHADEQAARIGDAAIQLNQSVRTSLAESQRQLDAYIQDHHDMLSGEPPSDNPQSPPIEENSQWKELRRQIAAQKSELASLLLQRTAAHPMVINVQTKIDALETQLQQVPQFAELPPSVPPAQLPPVDVAKIKEEHERLKQEVRQAQASLAAIDGRQQVAADGHRFYTSIRIDANQSPQVAGMIGGNFPLPRIGMLLAIATLLGGFAALCVPSAEQEAILVNSQEIASVAGLPIAAELPLAGGPAIPRKRTASRVAARFTVVASEYALVALVALLLVALLVDPGFARTFSREPFTALYDAQNQLWQFAH